MAGSWSRQGHAACGAGRPDRATGTRKTARPWSVNSRDEVWPSLPARLSEGWRRDAPEELAFLGSRSPSRCPGVLAELPLFRSKGWTQPAGSHRARRHPDHSRGRPVTLAVAGAGRSRTRHTPALREPCAPPATSRLSWHRSAVPGPGHPPACDGPAAGCGTAGLAGTRTVLPGKCQDTPGTAASG